MSWRSLRWTRCIAEEHIGLHSSQTRAWIWGFSNHRLIKGELAHLNRSQEHSTPKTGLIKQCDWSIPLSGWACVWSVIASHAQTPNLNAVINTCLLNKKLNRGEVSVLRSRNKWGGEAKGNDCCRVRYEAIEPGMSINSNHVACFSGGTFAGRALGSVSSRKCSHAKCGICFYDNNTLTSYHHSDGCCMTYEHRRFALMIRFISYSSE